MSHSGQQPPAVDPELLEKLRLLFKHDPSTSDLYQFFVHPQLKLLQDAQRLHPDFRKEVMPTFPRFAGSKFDSIPSYRPHSAIPDRLRPYTSLLKRFSALAFKEIDRLETALVMHDHLPPSKRTQYQMRLLALTDGLYPVWENWLLTLQEHRYRIIDREIQEWLNEPIDFDEIDLFKDDWEDPLYGAKAAKRFFDVIAPAVREFLGVVPSVFEYISSGKSIELFKLDVPVKLANERAKALNAKFRFKNG